MIELLIVIVILGILSVIGLGSFSSSQMKARDSRRKSDLRGVTEALEVFYNDTGAYPLSDEDGAIIGCGDPATGYEACTWGQIWQDDNGTIYMVQMPIDPKDVGYYYLSNGGTSYQLYARLENLEDRDIPKNESEQSLHYVDAQTGCGGQACNYGRSSTNTNLGETAL